jgi:aryl-alcohol dehydrogenase
VLRIQLGATHTINGAETDAVEKIGGITGGGANYSLETTAVPTAFRQAVDCLAPIGVCGLVGAAPIGTEASLDMNNILIPGRTVRGIVEGDSGSDVFIPRLIELYDKSRFPFDRLVEFYDLEEINRAAKDAEEGTTIKPVIRMP